MRPLNASSIASARIRSVEASAQRRFSHSARAASASFAERESGSFRRRGIAAEDGLRLHGFDGRDLDALV